MIAIVKNQRGVIPLGLLVVGFFAVTLAGLVAVTNNTGQKTINRALAMYSPNALIHSRERSGDCKGKFCLAPEIIDNAKKNPDSLLDPTNKEVHDTLQAATNATDPNHEEAKKIVEENNKTLYQQIQPQIQQSEAQATALAADRKTCLAKGKPYEWTGTECEKKPTVTPQTTNTTNTVTTTTIDSSDRHPPTPKPLTVSDSSDRHPPTPFSFTNEGTPFPFNGNPPTLPTSQPIDFSERHAPTPKPNGFIQWLQNTFPVPTPLPSIDIEQNRVQNPSTISLDRQPTDFSDRRGEPAPTPTPIDIENNRVTDPRLVPFIEMPKSNPVNTTQEFSKITDIPEGHYSFTNPSGDRVESFRSVNTDNIDVTRIDIKNNNGAVVEQKEISSGPVIVIKDNDLKSNKYSTYYYVTDANGNVTKAKVYVFDGKCSNFTTNDCIDKVATWVQNRRIDLTFLWDNLFGQPYLLPSPFNIH